MKETHTGTGFTDNIPVKAGETLRYRVTGITTATVQPQMQVEDGYEPVAEDITADMPFMKVLDAPSGRRTMFRFEITAYTAGTIVIVAD